jgi:hypothetical protein
MRSREAKYSYSEPVYKDKKADMRDGLPRSQLVGRGDGKKRKKDLKK